MMLRDRTFLVGIDDSEATLRTVSYVADTLGPQKGFQVVLLHVLPPIPPKLLEFGGSEDPQAEQGLDAELQKDQAQWIERAKQTAEPLVEKVKGIFLRVGVSADMITTVFAESIHRPDFVRELLETAHKTELWNHCCWTGIVPKFQGNVSPPCGRRVGSKRAGLWHLGGRITA